MNTLQLHKLNMRERGPTWVSAKELGRIWSLSPRTIDKYRQQGVFDGLVAKLPGKGWRYHLEAVELLFLELDQSSINQDLKD